METTKNNNYSTPKFMFSITLQDTLKNPILDPRLISNLTNKIAEYIVNKHFLFNLITNTNCFILEYQYREFLLAQVILDLETAKYIFTFKELNKG